MTITVLAVAGNGGSEARWRLVQPTLAEDIRLEPVTLPGFDGRALPIPPVSMEGFTAPLRRMAERVDTPVVVLGHGIGGSVAMHAAQQRGWVDGLILHAPVGPALDTRLFPKLMRPKPVRRAARWAISSPAGRLAGKAKYRSLSGDLVDEVFSAYRRCDAFPHFFDLLNAGWWESLEPITTPSVLLWGEEDAVLDESHLSGFGRVLPHAATNTQSGWGHYPMLEQPADYGRVISELARSLLSDSATADVSSA